MREIKTKQRSSKGKYRRKGNQRMDDEECDGFHNQYSLSKDKKEEIERNTK